jgi:hypothetical protein
VLRSASRISIEAQNGFARNNAARNGYSDNGKFCNDLNGPKTPKMSERPLKTLKDFTTSKLNAPRLLSKMAIISECRYRWLRVPATTFVITRSRSRFNYRDGFGCSKERGGGGVTASKCVWVRREGQAGILLSTEHYATPLARTHAVHEWERQIDIAEKIVT